MDNYYKEKKIQLMKNTVTKIKDFCKVQHMLLNDFASIAGYNVATIGRNAKALEKKFEEDKEEATTFLENDLLSYTISILFAIDSILFKSNEVTDYRFENVKSILLKDMYDTTMQIPIKAGQYEPVHIISSDQKWEILDFDNNKGFLCQFQYLNYKQQNSLSEISCDELNGKKIAFSVGYLLKYVDRIDDVCARINSFANNKKTPECYVSIIAKYRNYLGDIKNFDDNFLKICEENREILDLKCDDFTLDILDLVIATNQNGIIVIRDRSELTKIHRNLKKEFLNNTYFAYYIYDTCLYITDGYNKETIINTAPQENTMTSLLNEAINTGAFKNNPNNN